MINIVNAQESLKLKPWQWVIKSPQSGLSPTPSNASSKGAILVIHGLNNKPEAMEPLAQVLFNHGYSTYRLGLSGHGQSESEFLTVSRSLWINEMKQAIQNMPEPYYVVGFSLGGALFLDAISSDLSLPLPKASVFLAPAITPKHFRKLKILDFLNITKGQIPSMQDGRYRAHRATPIVAYRALLEISQALAFVVQQDRFLFPAQVWINKEDELVSSRRLDNWINARGLLSNWEMLWVESETNLRIVARKHHLFAPEVLGARQWNRMTNEIVQFFIKNE